MEFTDRELSLLSDGILALIRESAAAKLINSPNVWNAIEDYTNELQRLNTKICNYMEG